MGKIERTELEIAYDDRISRLKTALRIGMPADVAINKDMRLGMAMDALRGQHRGAVDAAVAVIENARPDDGPHAIVDRKLLDALRAAIQHGQRP